MLDHRRIFEICTPFSTPGDFAVGGAVPKKKLENARSALSIPPHESVLALMDLTVFGGNKEGVAVCAGGLYWNSPGTGKGHVDWARFASATLGEYDSRNSLEVIRGKRITVYHGHLKEPLQKLLRELRAEAAAAAATPEVQRAESWASLLIDTLSDFKKSLDGATGHDFRLEAAIPEKKLANARVAFPIPADERVLALVDFTVFGSNKEGIAIGTRGIYWSGFVGKCKGSIGWDEFVGLAVSERTVVLQLGGHTIPTPSGALERHHYLKLMAMLQEACVRHRAAGTEGLTGQDPLKVLAARLKDPLAEADQELGARDGRRCFTEREIPPRKDAAARLRFGIPDDERLLALLDLSDAGDVRAGLAIGTRGIYWRNDAEPAGRWLPWTRVAAHKPWLDHVDTRLIRMGAELTLPTPRRGRREGVLRLLDEVRVWAQENKDVLEPVAAPTVAAPVPAAPPPPPPPAATARRWMLSTGGNQMGPFDDAALERMVRAAELDPEACFAWTEGMPQWLPFRHVPDLDILAAPPPPMPPPPPPPAVMTPPPPPASGKRVVDF